GLKGAGLCPEGIPNEGEGNAPGKGVARGHGEDYTARLWERVAKGSFVPKMSSKCSLPHCTLKHQKFLVIAQAFPISRLFKIASNFIIRF
ncbi:MAG TPA: hypothetical protein DEH22_15660, partial [Chloroflexi bacterium]|nr:hypothetical protein [Chloroflexota bacterium]